MTDPRQYAEDWGARKRARYAKVQRERARRVFIAVGTVVVAALLIAGGNALFDYFRLLIKLAA
jgi:hypothetical protein